MLWGGGADWGFRAGYGHRTGNDYSTGDGLGIPSSHNSRDAELALGGDLTTDRHVEFHYLRQDQTAVELPGQAFDIDMLYTDGFEQDLAGCQLARATLRLGEPRGVRRVCGPPG